MRPQRAEESWRATARQLGRHSVPSWPRIVESGFRTLGCGALILLTFYLAWDYGGVLAWSQWLAVSVVSGIGLITLPVALLMLRRLPEERLTLGMLLIPAIGLIAWAMAWLQTLPVTPRWSRRLAPGSADAYELWIPREVRERLLGADGLAGTIARGEHPLSLSANLTREAMTGPALFAAVCLFATLLIRTRTAVWTVLLAIAAGGGGIAFLGIADQLRARAGATDDMIITAQAAMAAPFGPFVCRNNAAGYLNLSLAAALGLLVYAIRRHSIRIVGDGVIEGTDNSSPASHDRTRRFGPLAAAQTAILKIDPLTFGSLLLSCLCLAGILASQSRGGAVAAVVGFLVCGGLLGKRGSRVVLPMAAIVVLAAAAGLLQAVGMFQAVGDRLSTLTDMESSATGRLHHWTDALVAARHYLPAGAGLGTHRYAYLPYQKLSGAAWFVNADNLFVEWWVEGGIWLLGLVAVAILVFVARLRQLSEASQLPHVTALIVTGWFLTGSQLTSQFFDFGMLLPSLYLTLAILVGATFGVSLPGPSPSSSDGSSRLWRWPSWRLPSHGRSGVAFLLLSLATVHGITLGFAYRTMRQAAVERHRIQQLSRIRWSDGKLNASQLPLSDWAAESQNANLFTALAKAILASEAATGETALRELDADSTRDFAAEATIGARRAAFYLNAAQRSQTPDSVLLPGQSAEQIRMARWFSMEALIVCPLHDIARYQALETGFVDQESLETVRELILQWSRLRSGNPEVMLVIARVATIHPGGELAKAIIRQGVELQPGWGSRFQPMLDWLQAARP